MAAEYCLYCGHKRDDHIDGLECCECLGGDGECCDFYFCDCQFFVDD